MPGPEPIVFVQLAAGNWIRAAYIESVFVDHPQATVGDLGRPVVTVRTVTGERYKDSVHDSEGDANERCRELVEKLVWPRGRVPSRPLPIESDPAMLDRMA